MFPVRDMGRDKASAANRHHLELKDWEAVLCGRHKYQYVKQWREGNGRQELCSTRALFRNNKNINFLAMWLTMRFLGGGDSQIHPPAKACPAGCLMVPTFEKLWGSRTGEGSSISYQIFFRYLKGAQLLFIRTPLSFVKEMWIHY